MQTENSIDNEKIQQKCDKRESEMANGMGSMRMKSCNWSKERVENDGHQLSK